MVQFFLHKNTQKNASEFLTTDGLTRRLHTEQDDWHQWVKKQQCVASICSRFQIIFPSQGLGVQTTFLIYPLIQQGVGLDRWAVCRYCGLYGLYARHSGSFIASNTHNKSPNPKKPFSLKSFVVCLVVFLESPTASPAERLQITRSAASWHWAWCRRGIENRTSRDVRWLVLWKVCVDRCRRWELLPCPGIFLGLLIDRTSHGAILHRALPGKVPLFLWEDKAWQLINTCINKAQLYDHQQ